MRTTVRRPIVLAAAVIGAAGWIAGCSRPAPRPSAEDDALMAGAERATEAERSYGEDAAFLAAHAATVELAAEDGMARIVVVPGWQGRVMTSTAAGLEGDSFGWINDDLVASGEQQPHINALGGEDRFWMGPEGGQFSIFFAPDDPFDLEHWQTPPAIDTEGYEVVSQDPRAIVMRHAASLTNYSRTSFEVGIERGVRLLDRAAAAAALDVEIPADVRVVAFESENTIRNTGREAWSKETGLLSIWILGMFKHSPSTTVAIPFRVGPESELGPVVNDAYFGKVPADRLRVDDGVLFFKADGRYRSKIGLGPMRARSVAGSYDAQRGVLSVVEYTQPAGATGYVNSMWEIQDEPYAGDVLNSYNDGPPAPGTEPLGPFYEMESSSPAAALAPGASITHRHRTVHLAGARDALDRIARAKLGVGLDRITTALVSSR